MPPPLHSAVVRALSDAGLLPSLLARSPDARFAEDGDVQQFPLRLSVLPDSPHTDIHSTEAYLARTAAADPRTGTYTSSLPRVPTHRHRGLPRSLAAASPEATLLLLLKHAPGGRLALEHSAIAATDDRAPTAAARSRPATRDESQPQSPPKRGRVRAPSHSVRVSAADARGWLAAMDGAAALACPAPQLQPLLAHLAGLSWADRKQRRAQAAAPRLLRAAQAHAVADAQRAAELYARMATATALPSLPWAPSVAPVLAASDDSQPHADSAAPSPRGASIAVAEALPQPLAILTASQLARVHEAPRPATSASAAPLARSRTAAAYGSAFGPAPALPRVGTRAARPGTSSVLGTLVAAVPVAQASPRDLSRPSTHAARARPLPPAPGFSGFPASRAGPRPAPSAPANPAAELSLAQVAAVQARLLGKANLRPMTKRKDTSRQ
jgi:hypothetical protein